MAIRPSLAFCSMNHMNKLGSTVGLFLFACASFGETVVEHYIQRGDVTLVYETEGKGDPVIVLAGGPGVTPSSVQPVVDEVAKHYLAVLVHQRGTGKTK